MSGLAAAYVANLTALEPAHAYKCHPGHCVCPTAVQAQAIMETGK